MFAVTNFLSLNEVDVVPVNWLSEVSGKCMCYWPPYKTVQRIEKAKLSSEKPTSLWSSYEVKCLYKNSKYCLH